MNLKGKILVLEIPIFNKQPHSKFCAEGSLLLTNGKIIVSYMLQRCPCMYMRASTLYVEMINACVRCYHGAKKKKRRNACWMLLLNKCVVRPRWMGDDMT